MKPTLTLLFGMLAGVGFCQPTPTPADLLDRMRRAYAEARTYRDQGRVTVAYLAGKKPEAPRVKAFSTAFGRDVGVRFAYAETSASGTPHCGVAWSAGPRTRLWQSYRNAVDSTLSPARAFGLLGAPSGSASRRVVGLLLNDPNLSLGWDKTLRNVQLVGQEPVNDRPAYHLSATSGGNILESQVHLWLDAASGLLLRFSERGKVADYEALTTIDFAPILNAELPPGALAFDYQQCVK